MKNKSNKGFTLIEVLLVIAIITILAGIVIVAINPKKQTDSAENAQRLADVNTLSSAISQYIIENGDFPDSITSTEQEICLKNKNCGGADLDTLIPDYITAIPQDPSSDDRRSSGYTVKTDDGNRVTVSAPNADADKDISVTR